MFRRLTQLIVAVMISAQARQTDYRFLLQRLQTAIVEHAKGSQSGSILSSYPQHYLEELLQGCLEVKEVGYSPGFMMIDGDDAK